MTAAEEKRRIAVTAELLEKCVAVYLEMLRSIKDSRLASVKYVLAIRAALADKKGAKHITMDLAPNAQKFSRGYFPAFFRRADNVWTTFRRENPLMRRLFKVSSEEYFDRVTK